jgi:nitronate monooxygenase
VSQAFIDTPFTQQLGIQVPIIAGAMYPCSNPELVAAASAGGGIGIVQPVSLTYVHGYDFREGLRYIKTLTSRPIGMNALIEQSSRRYRDKMAHWIDIALEEGVRFFVTSLGKPGWVVQRVHAAGGRVYHDATESKWAKKGLEEGVDGLIAVNNRAGGHAGTRSARALYDELAVYNVPLICAGGIGDADDFVQALQQGYAGVQMGTRFIATRECTASAAYKAAILAAQEQDIVHSERITGVPVAVINTPYITRTGLHAGPLARWLLRSARGKHLMRMIYAFKSLYQLKQASLDAAGEKEYWQAGKSVAGIHEVESVPAIFDRFLRAWQEKKTSTIFS